MSNERPTFKHAASTSEGRIERAVFFLKLGETKGVPVANTMAYLKGRGCTDTEVTEALNIASGGELVRSALS